MAWAIVFPRGTSINVHSDDLGREGIAQFGLISEIGLRYSFSNFMFAQIGGRIGLGLGVVNFPDSKLSSELTGFYTSTFLSCFVGMGFTIGRKREVLERVEVSYNAREKLDEKGNDYQERDISDFNKNDLSQYVSGVLQRPFLLCAVQKNQLIDEDEVNE